MRVFRNVWIKVAVLASATVLQAAGLPTSCVDFGANFATASLNVCGVFNCEGGAFFDFCEPIVIFYDCLGPTGP
ncbi:MAG TPA: hypothetical protein PKC49_07500 [Phycisphaerae bacterium]|jgi:hypothetical protein|nr:hypothetical protein [Phycisphaerae bacterium]